MLQRAKKPYFTTIEILFLSSMIGLDFAYGLVVVPILSAAGILEVIRIDMFIPVMMMLVTRLTVDRFGTLIVYELVWGLLAVMAKPSSFGIPGFFKLIPALAYGIILDSLMQLFKNRPYPRLLIAGVVGGLVNTVAFLGIRMLFGMPWSTVVKILLGINLITVTIVNLVGVHLAFLVWRSLERSGWVQRLHSWRTS